MPHGRLEEHAKIATCWTAIRGIDDILPSRFFLPTLPLVPSFYYAQHNRLSNSQKSPGLRFLPIWGRIDAPVVNTCEAMGGGVGETCRCMQRQLQRTQPLLPPPSFVVSPFVFCLVSVCRFFVCVTSCVVSCLFFSCCFFWRVVVAVVALCVVAFVCRACCVLRVFF